MTWFFGGKPFLPEDIGDSFGFIYRITRLDTGRNYLGQKRFYKKVSRPPLKGKTRKRRSLVESDWQDYFGSNEELLMEVAQLGKDAFRRDILRLCSSKGELNYWELWQQMMEHVLLNPETYYNSYCGGRINRSHVKKKF